MYAVEWEGGGGEWGGVNFEEKFGVRIAEGSKVGGKFEIGLPVGKYGEMKKEAGFHLISNYLKGMEKSGKMEMLPEPKPKKGVKFDGEVPMDFDSQRDDPEYPNNFSPLKKLKEDHRKEFGTDHHDKFYKPMTTMSGATVKKSLKKQCTIDHKHGEFVEIDLKGLFNLNDMHFPLDFDALKVMENGDIYPTTYDNPKFGTSTITGHFDMKTKQFTLNNEFTDIDAMMSFKGTIDTFNDRIKGNWEIPFKDTLRKDIAFFWKLMDKDHDGDIDGTFIVNGPVSDLLDWKTTNIKQLIGKFAANNFQQCALLGSLGTELASVIPGFKSTLQVAPVSPGKTPKRCGSGHELDDGLNHIEEQEIKKDCLFTFDLRGTINLNDAETPIELENLKVDCDGKIHTMTGQIAGGSPFKVDGYVDIAHGGLMNIFVYFPDERVRMNYLGTIDQETGKFEGKLLSSWDQNTDMHTFEKKNGLMFTNDLDD